MTHRSRRLFDNSGGEGDPRGPFEIMTFRSLTPQERKTAQMIGQGALNIEIPDGVVSDRVSADAAGVLDIIALTSAKNVTPSQETSIPEDGLFGDIDEFLALYAQYKARESDA